VEEKWNGWICYWPDSDKPWIALDFRWLVEGAASIYATGRPMEAYDNTGVTKVHYKVESIKVPNVAAGTIISENDVPAVSPQQQYIWTFSPPSAPGTYKITLWAEDNNSPPLRGDTKPDISGSWTPTLREST
jgi:hypothetical protein